MKLLEIQQLFLMFILFNPPFKNTSSLSAVHDIGIKKDYKTLKKFLKFWKNDKISNLKIVKNTQNLKADKIASKYVESF